MLPCVVLGGGLGTRLGPETAQVPKPLVEVAGLPFAVRQIRWLSREGVRDVVYSIGHLGRLIREELRKHDLGCSVRFVDEGTTPLGTGGAIRLAVDEGAVDGPFLVLYGDSLLDVAISQVVEAFGLAEAEALMTVYRNEGAMAANNVVVEDARVQRYDKAEPDPPAAGMHHIDYGLSVLHADTVRRLLPSGQAADLGVVFADLANHGELAAHEVHQRFYEIGSPTGLEELRRHLGQAP